MTTQTHSSGLIPDQLLNNIKKGDCALFLGADLPLGYAGAPLSRPELAQALAAKHGLAPQHPWQETAAAYLGKVHNDRRGLIDFVREHVDFVIDEVMVEIKAKALLEEVDLVQTLSYLKASGHKVGLLINFGAAKLQVKRLAN